MGAFKCVVVLDCDSPPKILVGQRLGGGIVKEIKKFRQNCYQLHNLLKNTALALIQFTESFQVLVKARGVSFYTIQRLQMKS